MLNPKKFLDSLLDNEIDFYCGVPDSLLKQFCACVTETLDTDKHTITANEGGAMGLAIGYHIGTGRLPLVYLQNSGLGNIINPLISLASNEVYGIPMIIMIGWRGEPNIKDEPQHIHQGRVMMETLYAMNIPTHILSDNDDLAIKQTSNAIEEAKEKNSPVVLVVKKNTFDKFDTTTPSCDISLSREDAITEVTNNLSNDDLIVCTTGMPSRELFEFRANNSLGHHRDFLTVGGMGHASQIALGIAKTQNKSQVYCFDGDGAILMHMGSLPIIGQSNVTNLVHVLFNNGVHDSVGGQPTVGFEVDFCKIAEASGYKSATKVFTKNEIKKCILSIMPDTGPHFVEIVVKPGNRKDIGRPTTTPAENKLAMMNHIKNNA